MKRALLTLLLITGLPASGVAQESTTTAGSPPPGASGPLPLIPVRILPSGGVRIHSSRDLRPVYVIPAADSTAPVALQGDAANRSDLAALERRLMARLDRMASQPGAPDPGVTSPDSAYAALLADFEARMSEDLAALRVNVDTADLPLYPDSSITSAQLAALETRLAQRMDNRFAALQALITSGMNRPQVPSPVLQQPVQPATPPAVSTGTPTVVEVERAILETGLFRSVSVLFAFDRAELLPASYPTLDAVGEVLRKHPAVRIDIIGHTDASGPAEYNQRLSERRAASVRTYLSQTAGVAGDRIGAIGRGETDPIADNTNQFGRQMNRRVEFQARR